MLTKPLDSVLLSLKLMGLPDPRRALRRCITPPDDDQVGTYGMGLADGSMCLISPLPPYDGRL